MNRRLCGSLLIAAAVFVVGCGEAAKEKEVKKASKAPGKEVAQAPNESGHTGWWCDEHGVKEEVCSMCSSKVAKAFQDKGDWCKEHTRAKSQCFICDPSLQKKFAAEYVAKYGKEPPEPTAQLPEPKEEKKEKK